MFATCPGGSTFEKVERVIDFALLEDDVNCPWTIIVDVTDLRPSRCAVTPIDNLRLSQLGGKSPELCFAER